MLYLWVFLGGMSSCDVSLVLLAKVSTCEGRECREVPIFFLGEKHLLECFLIIEHLPQILVGAKIGNEQARHLFGIHLEFKCLLLLDTTHDSLLLLLIYILDFAAKNLEASTVGLVLDG